MRKKTIKKILVGLIIAGIGSGIYFGYTNYKSSKNAKVATNYTTAKVSKKNLEVSIQGTGTVFASTTKNIVPNNSGEVKTLNVNEGDTVKKGDKLFSVYNSQLEDAVAKAETNVKKQELELEEAKSEKEIEMQNLSLDEAEEELAKAIEQRHKMAVTSPISGLVVSKNNNNGDSVQANNEILSIVDTSSLKIKVAVDELDISKIKVGQKATIKFDAVENKEYEGTVEVISQLGETSNNVTTYNVTVSIKDLSGIKIGMNGNVSILVASKENALVVPVEALIDKDDGKYVRVSASSEANAQDESEASTKNNTTSKSEDPSDKGNEVDGETSATTNEKTSSNEKSTNNNKSNNARSKSTNNTNSKGSLVKVETGIENESYVEITSGLKEGEEILITLPETSTKTTTNANAKSGFGSGMSGQMPGAGGTGAGGNRKK